MTTASNWNDTPFYFLNLDAELERRDWMEKQFAAQGVSAARWSAVLVDRAEGFLNRAVHGNWVSHMLLAKKAAQHAKTPGVWATGIFEDDVDFHENFKAAYMAARQLGVEEWDVFFFYGGKSPKPERLVYTLQAHAYLINSAIAHEYYDCLKEEYERIKTSGNKSASTCLDQYLAFTLQKKFKFLGVATVCKQQQDRFGSSLGWGFGGQPVRIED